MAHVGESAQRAKKAARVTSKSLPSPCSISLWIKKTFYRVSSAAAFVDVHAFWLITGSLRPPSSIAAKLLLPSAVTFVPAPR